VEDSEERRVDDDRERHFVQSFARGLGVIRSFADARGRLTVAEVAEFSDMSSAAARRFVFTLTDLGYLRAEGRHYALTAKALRLGDAYLASVALPANVQPHLGPLVRKMIDTTSLRVLDAGVAVRDGDDVVYVAYVRAESLFVLNVSTGSRYPAWIASTGRVLLGAETSAELEAYLSRVRLEKYTARTLATAGALRRNVTETAERGWAMVDQEFDERLCSYAVPIFDRSRSIVAALNVSVMHAANEPQSAAVVEGLVHAATGIEADLRRRARRPDRSA
jgi:IclR family transcriptional regulator, pca regulon regulatory protein